MIEAAVLLALVVALIFGTPLALGYFLPRVYGRALAYKIWLSMSLLVTLCGMVITLSLSRLDRELALYQTWTTVSGTSEQEPGSTFLVAVPFVSIVALFIVSTRVGLWLGWRGQGDGN